MSIKGLLFEIITNTLQGNARFSKNKNVFAEYDKAKIHIKNRSKNSKVFDTKLIGGKISQYFTIF